MEMKYATSGAINHEHYNLVQKVENAKDPGLADEAIIHEIDTMRDRFHKPSFASSSPYCRDMLLILMYCETAMTFELPQKDYLEFALPAAVGLAGGGRNLPDRRVGYQYCIKIMPPDHELQLMLINTYRKDLESHDEARVCLALDAFIQSSTPDLIPAIDTRLEDLLSHKSARVKHRVMTALRRLSIHDPEILHRATRKITKRLQDNPVTGAAMLLAVDLVKAGITPFGDITTIMISLLEKPRTARSSQVSKVKAVAVLGDLIESIPYVEHQPLADVVMQCCATTSSQEVKLACFRALSHFPTDAMEHFMSSPGSPPHPVSSIKPLLFSNNANQQYIALSCLLALPVQLWIGTSEKISAQLEEADVHRIMSFLASNDSTIRVMTIRLLNRVDPTILIAYLDQYIANIPGPVRHTLAKCEHYASRALEIAQQLDVNDGVAFSGRVVTTLAAVQCPRDVSQEEQARRDTAYLEAALRAGLGAGVKAVLEEAAEMVLSHLRDASEDFRSSFTEAICRSIFTDKGSVTPTAVLLCAAVACEYGSLLKGLEAQDVLAGLTRLFEIASPALREALLIAMIRVMARCEEIPDTIVATVSGVYDSAGRHIRFRCKQFLDLAKDLEATRKVISDAKSSTLPDTLLAIDAYAAHLAQAQSPTRIASSASLASSMRSSRPAQRLKYDAYEAPLVASSKLSPPRVRRPSKTPSASSRPNYSRRTSDPHLDDDDPMAMTLSPGRLALAVGDGDLKYLGSPTRDQLSPEAMAARIDLISLESPFHVETGSSGLPSPSPASAAAVDVSLHARFQAAWDTLCTTSRGWGESSPSDIAKHLQELGLVIEAPELDVFSGGTEGKNELLGIANGADGVVGAAVRLRPGEDDSCLWILKCDSMDLRQKIRQVLQRER
ncbi:hypothetical protein FRB94_007638 [Tulasnella sp. JGI-2019a]|nr:hypothetical protein FRB94_007638 [Tulasnella sp. JGI-2019a]